MKKILLSATMLGIIGYGAFSISPAYSNTAVQEMPAGTYKLDKTHASLIWKVSHIGLSNYTARFTDFDTTLDFDPQNIEASKVSATINPTSIETDYPYPEKKDFDKKLIENEEWFNAKSFPEIKFESTDIKKTGKTTGTMTGNLTFLGVTKPVTLDITFNGAYEKQPFSQKPALGFSANGTIKRSDWGFSTYVPNIGDDVQIQIEAEFGMDG